MSEMEVVYLDTLDGFEFESFCEKLFQKLNWGEVEHIGMVGDGGRDIIIHTDAGSIIIECKHQPRSSVGRPIIQKLHSAVISYGAIKGIVITTGKFTKEARVHAEEISKETPIELYDFHILTDLANKVGIKLVLGGIVSQIYSVSFKSMEDIKNYFKPKIDLYQSFPKIPSDIMTIIPKFLVLSPYYLLNAEIFQNFTTSVGLIHTIHKKNLFLLFDATNGKLLSDEFSSFFKNIQLKEFNELPKIACKIIRNDFKLDVNNLTSYAKKSICEKYATLVHYTGMNNVSYSKHCKPGIRSVRINNTNQLLLPAYKLEFFCVNQNYGCHLMTNGKDLKILKFQLNTCKICARHINNKKLLCNDCGNIAHSPKFIKSHSYVCKNCKKTICKNCTYFWRKMIFFKRILCEECANIKPKSKKRLVKLK